MTPEKEKHSKRRHNTEKKKRRIKKIVKETFYSGKELAEDPKFVGKLAANHGASCSCSMCGNPRRYHNHVTKQEMIQLGLFPEMMKEFEEYGTEQKFDRD